MRCCSATVKPCAQFGAPFSASCECVFGGGSRYVNMMKGVVPVVGKRVLVSSRSDLLRLDPARSLAIAARHAKSRTPPKPPSTYSGHTASSSAHKRRREPQLKSSAAEPLPRTVTVPHGGLSAKQLSLLSGRSVDAVLAAARELEPGVGDSGDAMLNVALVELVTDSIGASLVLDRQVTALGSESSARSSFSEQDWLKLPQRVPVVTIMGHVDVGKTTLLDALRKSNVADMEAGGITQSIGAFRVALPGGTRDSASSNVTFIDTPGHEAFTSMRAQGASATDVIVLVVAADDGVMPQTIEAAEHARSAGVPIVVAINKCDKEGSDPERARYQLLDMARLNTEQLGGNVQCVEISAKSGLNLGGLVEAVLLEADLLDLRADLSAPAEGICLETRVDRQLGQMASIVIRWGSLRIGDYFVHSSTTALSGEVYGRVRTMRDSSGKSVKSAMAGDAVLVSGFRGPIHPGSELVAISGGEKEAKLRSSQVTGRNALAQSTVDLIEDIERRRNEEQSKADAKAKIIAAAQPTPTSGDPVDIHVQNSFETSGGSGPSEETDVIATSAPVSSEDAIPILNVVVKADVQGAADAVAQCVERLNTTESPIRILSVGVGDVTENDVTLVSATRSLKKNVNEFMIVAFNVKVASGARGVAKRGKVDILRHSLIYKLEDDIVLRNKKFVEARQVRESIVGVAGCIRVFEDGAVAGCRVQDGGLKVGMLGRVLRFGADKTSTEREVVHEELISSLKQFSKDVRNVEKGSECGVGLGDWKGFEPGDLLECVEAVTGNVQEKTPGPKGGRRSKR